MVKEVNPKIHVNEKDRPKVNAEVTIPNVSNQDGSPIVLYRLPSSSRAYPLAFAKKVEAYRAMFDRFL